MRILVFNPNSTESMTDGIVAAARAASPQGVDITGRTNVGAPPAIQGPEDGEAATPGVLAAAATAAEEGFDALILACFDDIGLQAARASTAIPVLGIGQAAYHGAMLFGGRFSVITTLPVSIPVIEEKISDYGLGDHCARVRASGLPVLTLEDEPERSTPVLIEQAQSAVREDGASALVLGCAGMGPYGPAMARACGVPAIDGVAAAVGLARVMVTAASRT